MFIFVKLPDHGFSMDVEPSSTIEDLKHKMEIEHGIRAVRTTVIFAGSQLRDGRTLEECGLQKEATIHVVVRSMDIEVQLESGSSIRVGVEPDWTIEQVKAKIFELQGVVPPKQQLERDGKELDDGCVLSAAGIAQDAQLKLVVLPGFESAMRILVRTLDGTTYTLFVEPTDTVEHIKVLVQGKSNIAVARQRLVYNGKQLDDATLVSDLGITSKHCMLQLIASRAPADGATADE